MNDDEVAFAGITGQRALLRSGQVTSVELLALSLRRIAELDPRLNAFRALYETAHAEAVAADERIAAGDDTPLLGVPLAVKDSLRVAGRATGLGTGSVESIAVADAEIARRLRDSGAVIVGATHLPELALWPFTETMTFGVTRNPWHLEHTPGGSSGGSAAAVAAGLVAGAHGSDGGGSIRIPAACCGLVGLKPTRDLVSMAPDDGHWHGLSVAGCLTRTVEDHVAMLNVLQDTHLEITDPGALRIAWSVKTPLPAPVHHDVRDALARAVTRLGELGHTTLEADPSYKGVQVSFLVRYATGAADDLAELHDPKATELRTRAVALLGRRLRGRPLARALRLGHEAAARLADLPGGADVLITPTLAAPPQRVGALTGLRTLALAGRRVPYTPAWNVTGQPALSVPAGWNADGLPLAVQLIGRPGSEALLLSLAAQLEGDLDRRPPVS